jgi:hypothetical protein
MAADATVKGGIISSTTLNTKPPSLFCYSLSKTAGTVPFILNLLQVPTLQPVRDHAIQRDLPQPNQHIVRDKESVCACLSHAFSILLAKD